MTHSRPDANLAPWQDDRNWHLGQIIYASRLDSRIFVPKRFANGDTSTLAKLSATPNFANWRAYPILGVMLAPAVVLIVAALRGGFHR